MPGERLGGQLVGAGLFAPDPQAHQPAAAHQRLGGEFALQAAWVAFEVAVGELGHVEGVVGILGDLQRQYLAPLAHNAHVAAIDQGRAHTRIGPAQEPLDIGALAQDHGGAQSPAGSPVGVTELAGGGTTLGGLVPLGWPVASQAASSSWMRRAASVATRSSASCCAAMEA